MHKVYWANFHNTVKMCTYDLLQCSNTGETEFNKTDNVRVTYH